MEHGLTEEETKIRVTREDAALNVKNCQGHPNGTGN